MMQRPRVVITGMGVLAANGTGLPAFWESLIAGRSGIRAISLFDATDFSVHAAGEVKDFNLSHITGESYKTNRMGRHTQLAIAAADMAIQQAGFTLEEIRLYEPLPVFVGVSTSAIDVIERGKDMMTSRGPQKVSPYIVAGCQPHALASAIGAHLKMSTTGTTFSTACAAGLDAIATAVEWILAGRADLIIAGGADAPINPLTVASFGSTGMVPEGLISPETLSRPFDKRRSGGIMAEGAGIFVMESLQHALARGATPLVEIKGYSSRSDRVGSQAGEGLADTMKQALDNSGLYPHDIDYVCAHGPSDLVIDRVETAMIKNVFGKRAYHFPVSSIKGVTGNPLAAAGPLQIAACAMGMRDGCVPPTANYEYPDPECDLDYVPNQHYVMSINRAMVNIHGLGGGNSSIVVEKITSA